jgi:hypothetical protein
MGNPGCNSPPEGAKMSSWRPQDDRLDRRLELHLNQPECAGDDGWSVQTELKDLVMGLTKVPDEGPCIWYQKPTLWATLVLIGLITINIILR